MRIIVGKRVGLKSAQVAWPTSAGAVREVYQKCSVTRVMYADVALLPDLACLHPHVREVYTTIISLDRPADDLLQEMDGKSCRYELRKALKLDPQHSVNQYRDEAFQLFQNFFKSSGYRGAMTPEEWEGYATVADLHTIHMDQDLVAAHLVLRDVPERVRLLLSATADRNSDRLRRAIGPLNRHLHWRELLFYQEQGVHEYDFGGILIDSADPRYSITQFKKSFGGRVEKQLNLVLIRNPILRVAARAFVASKPWLLELKRRVGQRRSPHSSA